MMTPTCIFSDVGVRNEIFADELSSCITCPLYQRPSVWRNLHLDPTEQRCSSSGSGSTSVGSRGSTFSSSAKIFVLCSTESASCNKRARFKWRSPSSASLIAWTSSSWTWDNRTIREIYHNVHETNYRNFPFPDIISQSLTNDNGPHFCQYNPGALKQMASFKRVEQ